MLNTDLTGWRVDEARVLLQSDPQSGEYAVQIIETAPPVRPPRAGSEKASKPGNEENKKSRPAVHYGAWRVLRCRVLTTPEDRSTLELLVAREQIMDAAV
ncbi:MAG TPA: hypothetical protein VNA16_01225 [Abditibacteriaceae bacterium]|nr:hypothetical protein [Abditibacteriaceae bacterium]